MKKVLNYVRQIWQSFSLIFVGFIWGRVTVTMICGLAGRRISPRTSSALSTRKLPADGRSADSLAIKCRRWPIIAEACATR